MYTSERPLSHRAHEATASAIAGGTSRAVLAFRPFPFRVARAHGATITDVDGHSYADFCGDYTAGLLGHDPPAVRAAIARVLDRGWAYGACPADEVTAARLVVERFPSIESLRFVNSGTEANLMAIALAKHVTGRDTVVAFRNGFHGSVLSFNDPRGAGALNVPHEVVLADYNSTASVAAAFMTRAEVACAIVEPLQGAGGCVLGCREFLEHLRSVCADHGALLIFDEVMTSRLAPGGLQAELDVAPDLTTLGKYLAGGLSTGVVGGRRELFAAFDPAAPEPVVHSGTFNNNAFSMAAMCAVLEHELSGEVIARANALGDVLRARLAEVLERTGPGDVAVAGHGSMLHLRARDARRLEWCFHHLLARGIYIGPTGMIALSACVTEGMIDQFVSAFAEWSAQAAGPATPPETGEEMRGRGR